MRMLRAGTPVKRSTSSIPAAVFVVTPEIRSGRCPNAYTDRCVRIRGTEDGHDEVGLNHFDGRRAIVGLEWRCPNLRDDDVRLQLRDS